MLRPAAPGDEPAIEAFLAQRPETSMFLRSNLRQFGLSGSDDPRATHYWLDEADGAIRAVFGRSNAGFVMQQAADAPPETWREFRAALAGKDVAGITGPPELVSTACECLGLGSARFSLHRPEPLFRLQLDALGMPATPGSLRAPTEADRALLQDWVLDYDTGTLGAADTAATRARVRATVSSAIEGDHTRIYEVDGAPVAKTAFNARLPDMVQIGGVYTPPALRGRGYARAAVALHLAEARADGVRAAILFAAGPAACRAYEAIGFRRAGSYSLAILAEPVTIGGDR